MPEAIYGANAVSFTALVPQPHARTAHDATLPLRTQVDLAALCEPCEKAPAGEEKAEAGERCCVRCKLTKNKDEFPLDLSLIHI